MNAGPPSINPTTEMTIVRHKPMMDMRGILMMNLGFFGIQYSFGMQQTAINPIYGILGASPHDLPLLNLAGPITGLLIQPLIGAWSDRTWHPRWGRRKPFFIVGAIGCSLCLLAFPFVSAIWMAALLLWLLDASNNTAMEPYKAFIADRLPPSQLAKGFLAQSFFAGLGITVANICLFIFERLFSGGLASGIPYWVLIAFLVGAVCSVTTVAISIITTPELPPSDEEIAALRTEGGGFGKMVAEIKDAIIDMPTELRKLALVYLFQWYAMSVYWQFITLSMAESIWNVDTTVEGFGKTEGYLAAVGWTGMVNGWYNIVTFLISFALANAARKRGAKWVHIVCLLCATVGLLIVPHLTNQYLVLIPIIGLGIAWASILGVPYIMAVRMIPSNRVGVYMGIINMMIVIPMLIQNLSFSWIYTNLLGSNPNAAISLAAILLGIAAAAMLWIKEPPIVRDVDSMFDDNRAASEAGA